MTPQKLHRNPPFRAEHLGSLKRPDDLIDKRTDFDQGKITADTLTPLEDAAIRDVVKMQTQLGFRAVSDGEYR
jgi:methionine synthase II (cobalamin-independent)